MTGPTNSPSHPTTNARPLWHRDSTPTTTAAAKRGYRRSSAPTSMVGAGLIGLSWCSQLRSASRVRRTLVSGPTPGSSRSTATCAMDCSTAGVRQPPRSQSAHRGLENRLRYRTAPQHPRRPHPQQPGPGLDRQKPNQCSSGGWTIKRGQRSRRWNRRPRWRLCHGRVPGRAHLTAAATARSSTEGYGHNQ